MPTAIKALLKEHQVVVRWDRRLQVYEHVADADVMGVTERKFRGIRRAAKRNLETLAYGVKRPGELEPKVQVERSTQMALNATILHVTSNEGRNSLPSGPRVQNGSRLAGDVASILGSKKS